MAISTIWKQHWSFILRVDTSYWLTYDRLKYTMWKTLCERILDDGKIEKEHSILSIYTHHGLPCAVPRVEAR